MVADEQDSSQIPVKRKVFKGNHTFVQCTYIHSTSSRHMKEP